MQYIENASILHMLTYLTLELVQLRFPQTDGWSIFGPFERTRLSCGQGDVCCVFIHQVQVWKLASFSREEIEIVRSIEEAANE